ncbi:MAG: hypothetical protein M1817_000394 [Caeruleum heppii]|nr:MAG: hypothetical protein M1817_000394 [Caeruleum heppii]
MTQPPSTPITSLSTSRSHTTPHFPAAPHQRSPFTVASLSSGSSNNTFLMPASPIKGRRTSGTSAKPKVLRSTGQRPACLVNASVTYCGDDQIYAFGGFDQYTDEVYNHVLRLDLNRLQWSLVDNYGDIPGVRMGHTATLYQGDKLLIYGGENEHRTYLSDLVMFDLKTAYWTQPPITGPVPKGRARHAAALYDDKLFIVGGVTGHSNSVLTDVCYLDLKRWTWSRTWSFVGRFDHSAWVWGERLWVFGGLGEDMDRGGDIWWLDLKGSPSFDSPPSIGHADRNDPNWRGSTSSRPGYTSAPPSYTAGGSGYAANSSSVQVNPSTSVRASHASVAPGAISSVNFVHSSSMPSQASGSHFHVYSSGTVLDFVTPASTIRTGDCCLASLELESLRWQKLAEGPEIFDAGYRWHYCTMNEDGTKAWLLGCVADHPNGPNGLYEEYLGDVLPIDLRKFGLLGSEEPRVSSDKFSASAAKANLPPSPLGIDLAHLFDVSPDSSSGADFTVTAEREDGDGDEQVDPGSPVLPRRGQEVSWCPASSSISPPIHVHKLILLARWPHFSRLYSSQMAEFHTKKMHIPEPYSVVRAFLYYLYTDSIAQHPSYCESLTQVAGLLVMANIYDMPRLRLLCVNRLHKELDVEHAAVIWERAGMANEEWLRRRAAGFCLTHWGRLVRTNGFRALSRGSLMELCEEVDTEGRVVGGEELEAVGGLGGGRYGMGGFARDGGLLVGQKGRTGTNVGQDGDELEAEGEDDEGMEMT